MGFGICTLKNGNPVTEEIAEEIDRNLDDGGLYEGQFRFNSEIGVYLAFGSAEEESEFRKKFIERHADNPNLWPLAECAWRVNQSAQEPRTQTDTLSSPVSGALDATDKLAQGISIAVGASFLASLGLGLAGYGVAAGTVAACLAAPVVAIPALIAGAYLLARQTPGAYASFKRLTGIEPSDGSGAQTARDALNIGFYAVSAVSTAVGLNSVVMAAKPALASASATLRQAILNEADEALEAAGGLASQSVSRARQALNETSTHLHSEAMGMAVRAQAAALSSAKARAESAVSLARTAAAGPAASEAGSTLLLSRSAIDASRTVQLGEAARIARDQTRAAFGALSSQTGQVRAALSGTPAAALTARLRRLQDAADFAAGGKLAHGVRFLLDNPHFGRLAARNAYLTWDAHRRALLSPEIWRSIARGNPMLSPAAAGALDRTGRAVNALFNYGSPGLGIASTALGSRELALAAMEGREVGIMDMARVLFEGLMAMAPMAANHVFNNAGRGNPMYGQRPALSPEITDARYRNPQHQANALKELDRAIPDSSASGASKIISRAHREIDGVNRKLDQLEILADTDALGTGQKSSAPLSVLPEDSTTPPPSRPLQADRRYRYPNHSPDRDTPALAAQRQAVKALSNGELAEQYRLGSLSPVDVAEMILSHPLSGEGCLFPRDLASAGLRVRELARESERRIRAGQARPFEGIFVGVKDTFFGLDGTLNGGSKTLKFVNPEDGSAELVTRLTALGAIPVPVGMTAAANGGSGLFNGWGAVGNSRRPGYDPAGSSSSAAYVAGLDDMPVNTVIGSDTGGSITAPAGAGGFHSLVPESGVLSMRGMSPFAAFLDRPGVFGNNRGDVLGLSKALAQPGGDPRMRYSDPAHAFSPSAERPGIFYLESLREKASPLARAHFDARLDELRANGFNVRGLDSRYDAIHETPMQIYPYDAYPAAAMAHTFGPNMFPRYTLDINMLDRLNRARHYLRAGIFNRAMETSDRFTGIVSRLFGTNSLLLSPSAEAVPLNQFLPGGKSGDLLDHHDLITMLKNRMQSWGQQNIPSSDNPSVGIAASGPLSALAWLNLP